MRERKQVLEQHPCPIFGTPPSAGLCGGDSTEAITCGAVLWYECAVRRWSSGRQRQETPANWVCIFPMDKLENAFTFLFLEAP